MTTTTTHDRVFEPDGFPLTLRIDRELALLDYRGGSCHLNGLGPGVWYPWM
jgi:hypothetical protein